MTTQPQDILIPFVPLIPCSQQLLKIESRQFLKLLSICWSKIFCQYIIFCRDYFHCLLLACVCLLILNEVRSVMLLCMLPDSELSQMNLFLNHPKVVDQERLLADHVLHFSREEYTEGPSKSLLLPPFSRAPQVFSSIPALLQLMQTSSRVFTPCIYSCPIPQSIFTTQLPK